MDIPLNAEVWCSDGLCGHTTTIIVNPITQKVTHIVVREIQPPHIERIVPETFISMATPVSILLICSHVELSELDEFIGTHYVRADIPFRYAQTDYTLYLPYSVADEIAMVSMEERIPPGELAIHRGARVEASDGFVGRVDEFLVDPTDGKISHLILREGHVWNQEVVTIPVSQIDHFDADTVYLKLDKASIGYLPTIPVRRWSR